MSYLSSTGIGDTAYFAPEAEFYVFDNVRFETKANTGITRSTRRPAPGTPAAFEDNNRGYKVKYKGGYFPVAPTDHFGELRDEMTIELEKSGLQVERAHHEVGTAGQAEINYRFAELLQRRRRRDEVQVHHQERRLAQRQDRDLHAEADLRRQRLRHALHQSIWNDGDPLFYDETGYAGLSDMARWYIGGILKHAPSLLAFTNPTVNSYHRLVPGFEAPISLVYSQRNRSACVRIPITGSNPKAKRIEFRCPDPSANPYLAFSALLLAGLDGIQNKTEPSDPIDKDIYELPPDEMADIDQVPTSLNAVLDNLERDHEFLTAGNVFTPDLIETWIDYKRTNEILPVQLRPHPHEFELYYDI